MGGLDQAKEEVPRIMENDGTIVCTGGGTGGRLLLLRTCRGSAPERGWGGRERATLRTSSEGGRRQGSALCTHPAPALCSTRLSANDRQKAAADEWIKQVIDGETMSKATGLLEQQAPT